MTLKKKKKKRYLMCKILRGNGNDLTNSNPVHGNGSADRCPD